MTQRLRLQAPAKINLHLRVGPPNADGFHPLLSWMCTVGLFDILTIEPLCEAIWPPSGGTQSGRTQSREGSSAGDAPGSAGAVAPVVLPIASPEAQSVASPAVRLTCDDPSLPCDHRNLIVRAVMALHSCVCDRDGQMGGGARASRLFDITAVLQKRIPMGAGLGGGSSDGATMLLGLNELWETGLNREMLAVISATLGSDLPFFCHGPSSVCTGRGEVVQPVPPPLAKWAVLFLPDVHMPTPAVYRQFDAMRLGDAHSLTEQPDWLAWSQLGAEALLPKLVNDLEAPAFALRPDLAALREWIAQVAARHVRMSGSGSSLFTLYDTELQARQAAADLTRAFANRSGQPSAPSTQMAVRTEVVEVAPI